MIISRSIHVDANGIISFFFYLLANLKPSAKMCRGAACSVGGQPSRTRSRGGEGGRVKLGRGKGRSPSTGALELSLWKMRRVKHIGEDELGFVSGGIGDPELNIKL